MSNQTRNAGLDLGFSGILMKKGFPVDVQLLQKLFFSVCLWSDKDSSRMTEVAFVYLNLFNCFNWGGKKIEGKTQSSLNKSMFDNLGGCAAVKSHSCWNLNTNQVCKKKKEWKK